MQDLGKIRFFRGLSRQAFLVRILFLAVNAFVVVVFVTCLVHAIRWVDKPFPGFLVNKRMALGSIGQIQWTGTQAGLRYPDRILEADGRKIRTIRDLQAVVSSVELGTPVVYKVERGGRIVDMRIPTMRFTLLDLLVIFGAWIIAGISYIVVADIVFLLKPDTGASWANFLFGAVLSVFSISVFEGQSSHGWPVSVNMLVYPFIFATIVHLSMRFPETKGVVARRPALEYVPYFLATIMATAWFLSYPGPLFLKIQSVVFLSLMFGALAFLGSIIHSFFSKKSPIARQRAKVVLFGVALAFPIPGFVVVAGLVFYGEMGKIQILNNILMVFLLIFPLSIAYAIAKHNLFDVDVYIKRTVGYAIMTAVVGATYLGLQVGLESVVLAPVFGSAARKITPVLFAFLVVFLFNPLNRMVQDGVDRMFYRKKFDYKATVTAVSDALSSVLNLDEIVRKIVGTVYSEMFIDRSGLVLAGAQGERLTSYFVGDDPSGAPEEIRSETLPANDPLVELVRKKKKLVTKYDVAEDPYFADVRETCGKRFEELGASLAVPLVYRGDVKAVLAVGHKKSGHFFTSEDIELLQTLASHGAVAIENANLAEQMKKDETVRTNLSRYLSPQIVDRIVKNDVQVNLGGDRKVVTILFSDIRNFTTITETRPPAQLVTILNEYFTEMARIIFEHQGSLDKYIGDAIVAVFGSLVPVENPAENAVAASVAMMKRLPELNRQWEARYGLYMNIGIGVNTGEVFLGNIGSPERMEFTVIGDAVNVASRFSGLAKPGQILVTKETLAHLGPDFQVREHPPAEVKGKSGMLGVFEIVYTQPDI